MNQKQIKKLLKAHCAIENGRWVFKKVDIDAATLELEQAIAAKPLVSGALPPDWGIDIYPSFDKGKWAAVCMGTISEPFDSPQDALNWGILHGGNDR